MTSTARATSATRAGSSSASWARPTTRSCSSGTWTSTRSPRSGRRGSSTGTAAPTPTTTWSDRSEDRARDRSMDFGFTLKPEHGIERTLALTRQAEAAGFTAGWLFDSHVLWRDPYPLLTLMAETTTRLRLGTCVTNPGTREPSVTASVLATPDGPGRGRM